MVPVYTSALVLLVQNKAKMWGVVERQVDFLASMFQVLRQNCSLAVFVSFAFLTELVLVASCHILLNPHMVTFLVPSQLVFTCLHS